MRLFEILLILCCSLSIIYLCFNNEKKRSDQKNFVLLCLLLLILILQVFWEGWRWQFVPVYILSIYIAYLLLSKRTLSRLNCILGFLIILITLGLSLFIPIPKHPDTTGPYEIGLHHIEVHSNDNTRRLPVSIWFPIHNTSIDFSSLEKAPWAKDLDNLKPALAERAALPSFIFSHLKYFKSAYYVSPEISPINSNKPLILLLHGRAGFKALNSFMAVELASHGYIVIAPDIPGGSLLTTLEDGTQIPFDPVLFAEDKPYSEDEKFEIIQTLGQKWEEDLNLTLSFFKKSFPHLKNKKVFAGGHSTGGAAAINFCQNSLDCLGVLALDPWMKPISLDILNQGSKKPILALFGDQSYDDFEPINQERYKQLATSTHERDVFIESIEIKKARHIDFCDAALLSPYSYLLGQQKGKVDTHIVMDKINQESLKFIDRFK